ncbi:MAG: transposase [Chitinophagales bacterium]
MDNKSKYNPQIHHRKSIRLKGYDYSQEGLYFITICTYKRKCLFGEIIKNADNDAEMILNEYGIIAHDEWLKTTEIRPNVELCEFVVMPNHFHGIIRLIGRGELHSPHNIDKPELHSPHNNETPELHLSEVDDMEKNKMGECNSPPQGPSQTIGAIIRGYKSSVTKQLNLLNIGCIVWQRNYHEHIIRNKQSYQNISNYIINNPSKWVEDKFYNK